MKGSKDFNFSLGEPRKKELKCIRVEDAGLLAHRYDQGDILSRDIPARLVPRQRRNMSS